MVIEGEHDTVDVDVVVDDVAVADVAVVDNHFERTYLVVLVVEIEDYIYIIH